MGGAATVFVIDLAIAGLALGIAAALRPWRLYRQGGPPWPTFAIAALMPLLWGLGRAGIADLPPLSGAPLLALLTGWPLGALLVIAAAGVAAFVAPPGWAEGLHHAVWLGLVPLTLAAAFGAIQRRVLPRHLFVYILGRAFVGTALVVVASRFVETRLVELLAQAPASGVLSAGDRMIAAVLSGFAEATLTGMIASIAVAFRPEWLATYSDRLYLLRKPEGG